MDGDSLEDAYIATPGAPIVPPTAPATLSLRRNSGGTQDSAGFFLQDVFSMNNFVATLSARVDSWKNHDGHIFENSVATGLPSAGNRGELPDKEDTVVSPSRRRSVSLSDRVSVWGDVGWGFRAPTLNELYRQFSVGLVRTLANENLGPERLFGGEAGVRLEAARNVSVRSTFYDNTVKDPVSNVTIGHQPPAASEPGTHAHSRLAERCRDARRLVDARRRRDTCSTTRRSPRTRPTPRSVGLYLPQVPKHRGSVSFSYSNPRYATFAVDRHVLRPPVRRRPERAHQARRDRARPAGRTASMDFSVSRDIGRHLDVFFGVQNLFDQEYYVMLLPTTTGSPRLVNGGIRVRFNGR